MSQDYGYGQNYSESGGTSFKAGINEGVNLVSFGLTPVSTANYNGNVIDVIWEKGGDQIKLRLFPVDETKVTARDGEEQIDAVKKAYGDLNATIKHVVTAFEHILPAEKQGTYDAVVKAATSFESLAKLAASYLPENFQENGGKLACGYNNKGFIQVPGAMWVTGHFFVVDGSDKEIVINPRYLKLERPVQAPTTPVVPTDTTW